MDNNIYAAIAYQCILVGGIAECVAILIGYVVFSIFRLFEGGD